MRLFKGLRSLVFVAKDFGLEEKLCYCIRVCVYVFEGRGVCSVDCGGFLIMILNFFSLVGVRVGVGSSV